MVIVLEVTRIAKVNTVKKINACHEKLTTCIILAKIVIKLHKEQNGCYGIRLIV